MKATRLDASLRRGKGEVALFFGEIPNTNIKNLTYNIFNVED